MALALGKMRAHDRAVQPLAQPRLVACLGVDLVLTKMVKVWGVLEFYFLEWQKFGACADLFKMVKVCCPLETVPWDYGWYAEGIIRSTRADGSK